MQGSQQNNSLASLKSEPVWFKTKLVSQFLTLSFLLSQPFYLPYLHAAPTGGEVVGGSGSINQSDLTTTINQNSQNLAIDWQSFDVNTNERVQFIQPNSSSIALNRILGNNGSTIQGQIDANGQVILVNPNGIFFTSTATINVGGIVASSLDMTPSDFMNGTYIFNEVLGTDGAVINSGIINASLGGSSIGGNVALIGKQIKNEGLITANLGSVILASGKQSVLTFDNQGLIGVKVTKEVLQEELGLEEAVINSGEINAAGGRVLLTASVSQDVFSQAVNTNSLNQATSVVVNADGTFTLGGGADVLNTGSIDVSSESNVNNTARIVLLGENITNSGNIKADVNNGQAGEIELHANNKTLLTQNSITSAKSLTTGQGGLIKVLGDKVGLFDNAQINASGANGGGTVLIGGDQEGNNTQVRNANFIYLGENTTVNADATDSGAGGKVIAFAMNSARIHGQIFACGGINGGDGGFIETSGLRGFEITSVPNASSYVGNNGTWLIDPFDITITNTTDNVNTDGNNSFFDAILTGATIDVDDINTGLGNGDVIIRTTRQAGTPVGVESGDITIEVDIDFDGIDNDLATLTLDADRNIKLDPNIRIYDSSSAGSGDQLNLNLFARGSVLLETGSSINTYGGNVTIGKDVIGTANDIIPTSFTNRGLIDTSGGSNQAGGNITVTTSGLIDITASAELKTDGGNASNGSVGQNGGDITLSAGALITIDSTSNISTIGSDGDRQGGAEKGEDAGNGGKVDISTSLNNILITSNIVTKGGDGDGDSNQAGTGGVGGQVEINAVSGDVTVGVIDTSGGDGQGDRNNSTDGFATGGNAGQITLSSSSNVTLNGNLDALGGGSGSASVDGSGNSITINGNTIINNSLTMNTTGLVNGDVTFNGSVSAANDRIEDLTITGKDITFRNDVGSSSTNRFNNLALTATGSVLAQTTDAVPVNTNFYVNTFDLIQSSGFTAGDIYATGADGAAAATISSTTNTVQLNADNTIIVGDIFANGGNASADGLNGGGISIDAQDITIGKLDSSGSDAVGAGIVGGDAGKIIVNATDNNSNGTPTITVNGDIDSSGGVGTTAGSGLAARLDLDGVASGIGQLTINYTGDFSSFINAWGSNGSDTLAGANRSNSWVMTGDGSGELNYNSTLNTGIVFETYEAIAGGTSSDTLTARMINNSWVVSGNGLGALTDTDNTSDVMNFSGMDNLQGNTGNDDFTIGASGNVSGFIDGGGDGSDTNTLTVQRTTDTNWIISGANSGTVTTSIIGSGFSNIHRIFSGSGNDTFTYTTASSSIRDFIDGGGERTATGDSLNMSALSTIDIRLGGTNDIGTGYLVVNNFETITGNNDGTDINNTNTAKITAENGRDNPWSLTSLNGGNVDSSTGTVNFVNFTDLTGGDQNDTFIIGTSGALSKGDNTSLINGLIDGAGHTTPLSSTNFGDALNLSSRLNILLTIDSLNGNSLTYDGPSLSTANVETIVGNGSTSTVTGENLVTTWNISGTDSGTVTSSGLTTYFSGFNNLTGGTANDAFIFTASGEITGLVDGTSGANDYVQMLAADVDSVAFSLSSTPNSNATNITNIDTVIGDGANGFVELIADDTVNTWTINGADRGNINNVVIFSNVSNITGGSNNDTFDYSGSSTAIYTTGLIDGGTGGNDIINMKLLTGDFTIDVSTDIARIDSINGNKSTGTGIPGTTLIGSDFNTTWSISGQNSGQLSYNDSAGVDPDINIDFTGFNNIEGQDNVNDIFQLSISGDISGNIDGGGGSGTDTVDYSQKFGEVINVASASSGISDIEQIKGDNTSTVLKGVVGNANLWDINGVITIDKDGYNDGVITYQDGGTKTLSFVNISKLEAGNAGDTFTIDGGGSFDGTITGGSGNDQVDLTLTGAESGLLTFNGNTGTDTLNIDGDSDNGGGGTGYTGIYTSNVDALNSDQFIYTNASNIYSIKYSGMATINDDLIANSLTVNGTDFRDRITLDTGTFQVSTLAPSAQINDAVLVNYSNKDSLYVDGLAGNNDIINIAGAISLTDTLSLNAETLTTAFATYPSITANELILNSVSNTGTSPTKKLNTNITNLSVINSGSLFVEDVSGINIAELQNTNTNAQLNIVANGDITGLIRNSTTDADLISNGTLSLEAQTGSILLNGNNQLTGQLNLLAANGDVELNNTTNTLLGTVTTGNLTVDANGTNTSISQVANLVITSTGLTSLSSSGNITLANENNLGVAINEFTTLAVGTAQSVTISDADTIGLNLIDATSVDITAVDNITDTNNTLNNVNASSLTLTAGTGIGSSTNAIETSVSSINTTTTSGGIYIDNIGNVKLTNLVVSNGGNITFINNGNVEISNVNAGFNTGIFTMTVLGGSVTGITPKDYIAFADITAYDADILVPGGTFGSAGRPISVRVQNQFDLFSLQSAVKYLIEPNFKRDISTAKISITDAFSNLAGQQLIEIESIGDVDPAIFTDVRNYNHSDLALMMPSDQRYDISDEEEDEEAKQKREKFLKSNP